jgi:maleate cis-trans isomerase
MGAYGWKATIGCILPPRTNETVINEAVRLAPEGVSWCWSVMGLPEFGQYQFDEALGRAGEAARELADRGVDIIVSSGIPLVTSKGPGYHERLEAELAAASGHRTPVTTDIHCVLGSLRALGLDEIALLSIYQRYIQDNLVRYLAHYGIRTVAEEGLSYALADCMTRPTMDTSYEAAVALSGKSPDAEGLFVSCPQWPVVGHVARLERETRKPVVAQLAAILWGCLSQLGLREPVTGYGRLLETWPAWVEPTVAPNAVESTR